MGLMDFLTGGTPEKLDARGDRLMASGRWGMAKLAFERALAKYEKAPAPPPDRCRALESKIRQAGEALAREHRNTALTYLDGGYIREARECLQLALDMTQDPELGAQLSEAMATLDVTEEPSGDEFGLDKYTAPFPQDMPGDAPASTPREQFDALCNTLPDEVAAAYRSYGEDFVAGYLALNDSDFDRAVVLLERALAAASGMDTFIPLELATAYMNVGRVTEARNLLEAFRHDHPDVLPACELLCAIYWETEAFDRAEALLNALPDGLIRSRAGILLKGETLYRAGRYADARDFYRTCLTNYGWDASVVQGLAQAHEALNEGAEALRLYRDVIARDRSCRTPVDPQIRHRYAELAFALGDRSESLLELYLALARELPARAGTCFDRISRIYAARNNAAESERFRAFAHRARTEQKGHGHQNEGCRRHGRST